MNAPLARRFAVWLALLACAAAAPRAHAAAPAPLLIADVTVVDVERGRTRGPVAVWVRDGRIVRIATRAPAHDAALRRIDGRGRYLVPGLIDLHVHLFNNATHRPPNDWMFPLLLGNGVTGVREMLTTPEELPQIAQWRAAVDRGELAAPYVLAAGVSPHAASDDAAAALVRTAARGGADFIKVFSETTPARWRTILAAARAERLPVDGHVPAAVALDEAGRAGQRTAEHLMQVYEACSSHGAALIAARQGLDGDTAVVRRDAQEREVLDTFDADVCAKAARDVAAHGPAQVPTIVLAYFDAARPQGDATADARWPLLRADEQARWHHYLDPPHDAAETALAERRWDVTCRIVRTFAAAGVPLYAGTDAPMPRVYPGYALHDELERLVDCGVEPAAALRGATSAAARLLGRRDVGRIAIGARADLVLLDADPIADIHALRRIDTVVLAGRAFDRAALAALLAPR